MPARSCSHIYAESKASISPGCYLHEFHRRRRESRPCVRERQCKDSLGSECAMDYYHYSTTTASNGETTATLPTNWLSERPSRHYGVPF